MSYKNVTANCGCVVEMDLSHDWESGVTDAEDVSIISLCDKHSASTLTALLKEAGEAIEMLNMNLSDGEIELAREVWGNTNTNIIKEAKRRAAEIRKKIQEVLP